MTQDPLRDAVERVVRSGNCSGCGACAQIDDRITMSLDRSGYARPVFSTSSVDTDRGLREFEQVCPGRLVRSPDVSGRATHPVLGPYVSAWRGWAADPDVRFAGSSGGVITALLAWAVESGEAAAGVAAAASDAEPTRTVSVSIQSREEALRSAGSRYAPASNAASVCGGQDVFVGKPCEVSATRALKELRQAASPLLLGFFCAGVPSQAATDRLVARLGLDEGHRVASLRYRGQGWPGSFRVVDDSGREYRATYQESWGEVLGRELQWRCKVCPDGLGRQADVVAGDLWSTDSRGFPSFVEAPGVSFVLARTARGHEALMRAAEAGAVVIEPVDLEASVAAQPYQVERLSTLGGRLVGTLLAGRPVPRYVGFGLAHRALVSPVRALRALVGGARRSIRWQKAAEGPAAR